MAKYQLGGHTYERKNHWLPCALNAQMDSMSDEEQARTLKETYWADNITNAEWPVMLQNVRNASTRSRLKRKVVGWLMTMGRIAALNPELYNQAVREARALYLRQIGSPHPMFSTEVADSVQPDDEVAP